MCPRCPLVNAFIGDERWQWRPQRRQSSLVIPARSRHSNELFTRIIKSLAIEIFRFKHSFDRNEYRRCGSAIIIIIRLVIIDWTATTRLNEQNQFLNHFFLFNVLARLPRSTYRHETGLSRLMIAILIINLNFFVGLLTFNWNEMPEWSNREKTTTTERVSKRKY